MLTVNDELIGQISGVRGDSNSRSNEPIAPPTKTAKYIQSTDMRSADVFTSDRCTPSFMYCALPHRITSLPYRLNPLAHLSQCGQAVRRVSRENKCMSGTVALYHCIDKRHKGQCGEYSCSLGELFISPYV